MCLKRIYKLLTFVFFCNNLIAQPNDTRPNIIYIMADDLGYADLSCYGRKDYQTPNLDKLCSQGVKFMNAYAAAPVCTPTRVAFMTGRYPARITVGLYEPIAESTKDSMVGLSPAYPSIATIVKEGGYETYLIGKWHLGYKPEFSPLKNGFDYFFGFHAGAIDYISHTNQRGKNDLYENDQLIKKDGYMTDLLMEKTIEVIKKPHVKPFFIVLTFNAPHWPWQGPDDQPYSDIRWTEGGTQTVYATMVKSLDNAVGSIIKTIDEAGIANNTVVIFTSDNGGEKFSDMGVYKGKKMELWEGGIREPAFIRWPGKIKVNSITTQVATTMDWTATIAGIAKAKPVNGFAFDGTDLTSIVTGKQKEINRTLYWRIFQRNQHKAMRDGKWKWLRDEKGNEYLFDLINDPSEKNNLKDQQKEVFEKLKKKYQLWEATMLKPIPLQQ